MVSETPIEKPARPPADAAHAAAEPQRMSGSSPGGMENGLAVRARIIAPSLLLPAEIVIFELKPSLWYVAFTSLPIAAAGLGLVFLGLAVPEFGDAVRHLCIVIGMWVIGLRVAWALLQWLGRTYVLTDRRILVQSGVVNVNVDSMGLEEIETTFVAQASAQRALGIGTLFFRATSAHCQSLAWEHISRPAEVHAQTIVQIDRWKRSLKPPA